MGTTALVLFIVACSVELALVAVFSGLWLGGRRRVRVLRGRLAELEGTQGPRRIVPTGREVVKGVWETANLVRDKGFGGALRTSIEDLAGWAQVERPDLVRLAGADGTVAILFSDIEGSTALNEELGDRRFVRVLARHDRTVRKHVGRHGGHVVKTQGDGFMVAFATASDAVAAAVGVQRAFDGDETVRVRIGVHVGDVVHRDGDIFGRNVALAARVAAQASAREVLVSDAVAEALPDGVDLGPARGVSLKGISGEQRVRAVAWTP